jgi:polysaccharide export outer membrane protein
MKKSLLTLLFIALFLPLNLFNHQIDQINQTNQIDRINLIYAQEPKKQLEAGPIQIFESYVIGQGDLLEVFVWRNEQLSREVVVRPDGKISLPLIQDVQAEGLRVLQLKDQITRRFSEYLENPRVTVIVKEINSYKVSVLGRVVKPGVYPITGNTTLVEAISMAGGFTEWANKRKITVITNQGGKKKKIRINYNKIISGKDPNQNIILQRDDTIVVP